jgi:ABC-type polysaccharide/polyol phosphate export permease
MILQIFTSWLKGSNKLERFWLMSKIEYKLRYYENSLGLIWALIKPISDIFIFYIAFEVIMKQGIPNFVSFLFIGIVLWTFFVESSMGTIQILATKKYLYSFTNMNKIEIYLSVLGSNIIGLFFNTIMFLIYYLLFSHNCYISWHIIFYVPIVFNLVILSLAFSLILSNIYIIAKDIQQIWIIVIGLGFWISPILYKLEVFRQSLPGVDYVNPVAGIIINARNVIMFNILPEWNLFIWDFIYSIFFLLIGIFLLNKLGSKAAEKL